MNLLNYSSVVVFLVFQPQKVICKVNPIFEGEDNCFAIRLFYSNSALLSLLIVKIFVERKMDFIFIDYSRNWYYLRSKETYFQVDGYKGMQLGNSLEKIIHISSKYLRNVQPWWWQKHEIQTQKKKWTIKLFLCFLQFYFNVHLLFGLQIKQQQ